jgi:hypothetical protein
MEADSKFIHFTTASVHPSSLIWVSQPAFG